ncbi:MULTISPECIES: spore germination protein [Paenibacillus]|uniref:spore germination protein n=1 Tax=Paenibacillus TaxID=44249 RepID=UPI0033AA6EDA
MNFAPMVLNIGGLKINAIDHAAVVNIGPSEHIDLFVSYKRNQGIGEQNGDISPMFLPVSWVSDTDLLDSNSIKNSIV